MDAIKTPREHLYEKQRAPPSVECAGVRRVVPAALPVLPRVAGVVHPARWKRPGEWPPLHHRQGLSLHLPVPVVAAVASAARCGLTAAVGPGSR